MIVPVCATLRDGLWLVRPSKLQSADTNQSAFKKHGFQAAAWAADKNVRWAHRARSYVPTHPDRTSPPIPCRTNSKAWLLLIALTTCSC